MILVVSDKLCGFLYGKAGVIEGADCSQLGLIGPGRLGSVEDMFEQHLEGRLGLLDRPFEAWVRL